MLSSAIHHSKHGGPALRGQECALQGTAGLWHQEGAQADHHRHGRDRWRGHRGDPEATEEGNEEEIDCG